MEKMIRLAIVSFQIKRKENNITTKDANKFYRKLYGYNNWSCYSRYRTFVKGFIHKINAVKLSKSTLIVPYKNLTTLTRYLRQENNVLFTIITTRIHMMKKDFEKMCKP